MEVSFLMKQFSTAIQEKFGLEVIINNQQYLLKKEDGKYFKYEINKDKTNYLKSKSSAKNDNVQHILKNRLIPITSDLTLNMSKNKEAFETLKHMFI